MENVYKYQCLDPTPRGSDITGVKTGLGLESFTGLSGDSNLQQNCQPHPGMDVLPPPPGK